MSEKKLIITTAKRGKITPSQKNILIDNEHLFNANDIQNFIQSLDFEKKIVCEIGFGNGDCLVEMARLHPEYSFFGIELYLPGIGAALIKIRDLGLKNVNVLNIDARLAWQFIPDSGLDRLHILFSDPWPKKRNNKRRLINSDMLLLWLKKIKVGGKIHIATDDNSYQEFIFEQVYKLSDVSVEDVNQLSFMPNCIKRPVTKFELRGLQLGNRVKEWCLVKLR